MAVGGPAVGQVVRLLMLLAMAAFTYWRVGTPAAASLVVEAGIVAVLAVIAYR